MWKMRWFALAVMVSGCTSDDPEAKFVGSWAYEPGSSAHVDCSGNAFDVPMDTIVETFAEAKGLLVKTDSQGCAGLEFAVSGNVASLSSAGQSCTIPASGSSPAATFAPSAYTFTISADHESLEQAVTASYTPSGAAACAVTGANMLARR